MNKTSPSRDLAARRLSKAFAIVGFNLLTLATAVAWATPLVNGYEISVYAAFPGYFWALVVSGLILGVLAVVSVGTSYPRSGPTWAAGIAVIVAANLLLMELPHIRGYALFGRSDELTHAGFILDIIQSGRIGSSNVYPLDHIFGVMIYFVASQTIAEVMSEVPILFSFFYVASLYLLARRLFGKTRETLGIVLIGSILIFGANQVQFAPDSESFFLVPLALFLYFRSRATTNRVQFSALLVLLLTAMIFFHPMTAFYVLIMLLCAEAAARVRKRAMNLIPREGKPDGGRGAANLIFVTVAIFFVWYFTAPPIGDSVAVLIDRLISIAGTSQAQSYANIISQAKVHVIDLVSLSAYAYGQLAILSAFAVPFAVASFRSLKSEGGRASISSSGADFFWALGFVAFSLFAMIFFFGYFLVGFERIERYTMLFATIIVGKNLSRLPLARSSSRVARSMKASTAARIGILPVVVILLVCLSTFNLYLSPIIRKENQQVAASELTGMRWFFEERNQSMTVYELGLSQARFYQALFGVNAPAVDLRYGAVATPVNHFGYQNGTALGEYYNQTGYLVISKLGRIFYQSIYPTYETEWRFTPSDFNSLENDSTVIRVYDDSGVTIYLYEAPA